MERSPGLTSPLDEARSILFVPGDRPERFAKALASGADAVILDLEDAVRPQAKAAARDAIAAHGATAPPASLLVRINAAGAEGHAADLALCRAPAVAAIVLPKAEAAATIDAVAATTGKPVWPLVETARGLAALPAIAASSAASRLVLGTIDLALDLEIRIGSPAGERMLDQARYAVVVAARVACRGRPVDGVHADIKDVDGLARAAASARDGGFGGMLCIHPAQSAVVNAAFSPSADECAWAERVVAAAIGQAGAFQLDGQMIDAPVVARAARILSRRDV